MFFQSDWINIDLIVFGFNVAAGFMVFGLCVIGVTLVIMMAAMLIWNIILGALGK